MPKRAHSLLASIAGALIGAYAARLGCEALHRDPVIAQGIVDRAWVEQSLGPAGVTFETPWPLESQEMPWPPEVAPMVAASNMLLHEADGLNITCLFVEFVAGTPIDLEGGADGAIENLKAAPGVVSVDGSKHESTILGRRAFRIEAHVERKMGQPVRVRGVVFGDRSAMYQITLICRSDQQLGEAAWERLVGSIRLIDV